MIVLMLENRSFDHMLGWLINPEKIPDGPPAVHQLERDPHHDHREVSRQLLGFMPKKFPAPLGPFTMKGFEASYKHAGGHPPDVLRVFRKEMVPVLWKLASEFAVCTRWHCSVPGQTWPNRNFVHAATSDGEIDNRIRFYSNPTIFERLEDAGASWRIYHQGPAQVWCFPALWPRPFRNRFDDHEDLFDDIENDELPAYSFVEPDHGLIFREARDSSNSQHPGNNEVHGRDFRAGEVLLHDVYTALSRTPAVWRKTLLVVTHDEHGGFADHVSPPNDVKPPGGRTNPEFGFTVLGPRVPALLISPWIPRGKRDERLFEHSAIPRALRELFAPASPPLSSREKWADSLLKILSLDSPRADIPTTRPGVWPAPLHHVETSSVALAGPPRRLGDFQQSLVGLTELVDAVLRAEDASPRVRHQSAARAPCALRPLGSRACSSPRQSARCTCTMSREGCSANLGTSSVGPAFTRFRGGPSCRRERSQGEGFWIASAVAVALVATSWGCATVRGTIPLPPQASPRGVFTIGTGRTDLTPPPGFPLGGHSLSGAPNVRGSWIRLKARAFWLEDKHGNGVALVSTDLWSMAEGLTDTVAETLVRWGVPIDRDRLVVAATHTHHSPAAFSSDRFFTVFAGARPGFDPRLHAFLSWRIAAAVKLAYDSRQPGRAILSSSRASLLFRNRSLGPFRLNPEADRLIRRNADLLDCQPHHPLYPDPVACKAVDPRITVLRLENQHRATIGVAAFLAAHPTVISHDADVYQADVFCAAAAQVEARLAVHGSSREETPVVAIFNGAQGDVSLLWDRQARPDLLTLASRLAGQIVQALGAEPNVLTGPIEAVRSRIDLDHACVSDLSKSTVCTAWIGFPGRATMCGAEDGRTTTPGWISREGIRGSPWSPHGRKIGALDIGPLRTFPILTRLALLFLSPPDVVPMSVIRIGRLGLVTLPGEFTTMTGHRIRVASKRALQKVGVKKIVLVGLANGYGLYTSTAEEYEAQHYEGSQTLYGPAQESLMVETAGSLASRVFKPERRTASDHYEHQAVPTTTFEPKETIDPEAICTPRSRPVFSPSPADLPVSALPSICWNDGPARLAAGPGSVVPRARVETFDEKKREWRPLILEGVVESDDGDRFVTLASVRSDGLRWCIHWFPPATLDTRASYRLVARGLDVDPPPANVVLEPATEPSWCDS